MYLSEKIPVRERKESHRKNPLYPTGGEQRTAPLQFMAIMAQNPPKGQEQMFEDLKKTAAGTPGVGSKVIEYDVSKHWITENVTDEVEQENEPMAILGHGCSTGIGDFKSDDIVNIIEGMSTAYFFTSMLANTENESYNWNGSIYLMGCETGRAYRPDESVPLGENEKSLADRVKEGLTQKKLSNNVVGTFASIMTKEVPEHSGVFKAYRPDYESMDAPSVPPLHQDAERLKLYNTMFELAYAPYCLDQSVKVYLNPLGIACPFPIDLGTPYRMRFNALQVARAVAGRLTAQFEKLKVQLDSQQAKLSPAFYSQKDAALREIDLLCGGCRETLAAMEKLAASLSGSLKFADNDLSNLKPEKPDGVEELLDKCREATAINLRVGAIWALFKEDSLCTIEVDFTDPASTFHTR